MPNLLGRRGVVLGLAALTASPVVAQTKDAQWVVLGKRLVSFETENDVVPVGLHKGLFTGLRIEAAGNAVFIEQLRVAFPKGEIVTLPVRSVIAAGSKSRDMLFPGLIRGIIRIEIVYRRAKLGGPASLTFFGRRSS